MSSMGVIAAHQLLFPSFSGATLAATLARDTQTTVARAAQTWFVEFGGPVLFTSFVTDIRIAGDYLLKIDGVTVATVNGVGAASNGVTFTPALALVLTSGRHTFQLTCGSTVQWYDRGNFADNTYSALTGTGRNYLGWDSWQEQTANVVHGQINFKIEDNTRLALMDDNNTSSGSFAAQTWPITFDTAVELYGVIHAQAFGTTSDFTVDGGSILDTVTHLVSGSTVPHGYFPAAVVSLAAGARSFKIDPTGTSRMIFRTGTAGTPSGDSHVTAIGVWGESTSNQVGARIIYRLPLV